MRVLTCFVRRMLKTQDFSGSKGGAKVGALAGAGVPTGSDGFRGPRKHC